MTPAKASKVDQAANLPLAQHPANWPDVDAADAWRRFSSTWPFDPVAFRRAAARAEFEKLTDAEREEAIRCARLFVKARRASGLRAVPDARRWLKAKGWQAFASAPTRLGQGWRRRSNGR